MGLMRREPQNENRSSSRPSEYVLYLYVYHSDMLIDIQTIGLVSSTPVPFTSVALGQKTFQITTSVEMSTNLRPQARPRPHIPYSTADSSGYHCDVSKQRCSLCSIWRRGLGSRILGFQAGEEGRRIGCSHRPRRTNQADFDLRHMDHRMLYDED